jgi:AbrB family looped-hinge helix DNA binding protein
MKSTAVVGEKGQVTIPKRLRLRLGIQPGTELRFEEHDGNLVATRSDVHDPLLALVGTGKQRKVDAVLTELRGPGYHAKRDGGR